MRGKAFSISVSLMKSNKHPHQKVGVFLSHSPVSEASLHEQATLTMIFREKIINGGIDS